MSIIIFTSCEKEQNVSFKQDNDPTSKNESEGKFKEEIVVSDECGNNQAFYAVYSDDENLLLEYIKRHEFSLKINEIDIQNLKSNDFNTQKSALISDINDFDLTQEPKIIFELVSTNLQDDVVNYSLEINSVNLKSANDFIFGYPIGFETKNDFIGAVHKGYGYEFVTKFRYKNCGFLCSWKDFEVMGVNAWFVYPASLYYICLDESYDFYKRELILYPHYYQSGVNYRIAYSRNEFRGQFCTIGSYDTENCYVGTPPSGTTAFIWGDANGQHFYYTPLNGNQCPLPGSSFDGANCYVMTIPSNCDPFVWSNNWYVRTDVIE